MSPNTVKARAGAVGAGLTGPAAGFAILYAINEVIPDAPWLARAFLFCIVAGLVGYYTVWRAPPNETGGQ